MRLFIAVELGDEIRASAAEQIRRLTRRSPEAKWVSAETMHVTLAFLGEVAGEKLPALQAAVEAVAGRHAPMLLEVRGGGTFGGARRPRVLWVGLSGDLEALAQTQADLAAQLIPLGYSPELRDFHPHLTLARARNPHGDPALAICAEQLRSATLGSVEVRELVLFRSQLSPHGARHTALARAWFARPPPRSPQVAR